MKRTGKIIGLLLAASMALALLPTSAVRAAASNMY